jgi:hypothetical protein
MVFQDCDDFIFYLYLSEYWLCKMSDDNLPKHPYFWYRYLNVMCAFQLFKW